jgi:tetratricopeptide (TPR) repeat protein
MPGGLYEAEENYRRALGENPRLWQAHLGLAKVYIAMGDISKEPERYQEAWDELEEVWKRIPEQEREKNNKTFLQLRGYIKAKLGQFREAKEYYRECSLRYKEPIAMRNLGRINEALPQRRKEQGLFWGGVALAGIAFVLLIISSVFYFTALKKAGVESKESLVKGQEVAGSLRDSLSEKGVYIFLNPESKDKGQNIKASIDKDVFMVIVPACLFFIALGIGLPYISRFKMGTMEFEKETIVRPELGKLESESLVAPLSSPG